MGLLAKCTHCKLDTGQDFIYHLNPIYLFLTVPCYQSRYLVSRYQGQVELSPGSNDTPKFGIPLSPMCVVTKLSEQLSLCEGTGEIVPTYTCHGVAESCLWTPSLLFGQWVLSVWKLDPVWSPVQLSNFIGVPVFSILGFLLMTTLLSDDILVVSASNLPPRDSVFH